MTDDPTRHRRGVALMFCAGLLWSIAGVFTRQIEQAPRWETTFWRSFFCALAMVVILLVLHRGRAVAEVVRLGRVGFVSGALWAVMFTGFMLALTQTSTANTLVLTSLAPLTAALFAWLLLGERVPRRTWLFIGAALVGILVMFGGEAGGGRMAGNLIALIVPLAAGLNFVLMRKTGARINLIPAVLVGGLLSALATLPLAWPCILSSLLLTFTVSFDEFILAFFLSSNSPTLPVYMWSQMRFPDRLPLVLALAGWTPRRRRR